MQRLWFPDGQKRLGRSASNKLIIINPPPPPPAERGLFLLPDEIFLRIVQAATEPDSPADYYASDNLVDKYRLFVAPSVVCRRFNRLVTPLLYNDIDISLEEKYYRISLSLGAIWRLYRTLKGNPALRDHSRKLRISLSSKGDRVQDALPMIAEMTTFFTNVRSFILSFPWEGSEGDLPVLRAAGSHMTKLEDFCLFGGDTGPSLGFVCRALSGLSHLREFSFYPGNCEVKRDDTSKRSCSLTTVNLYTFTGTAEDLRNFLSWPVHLEHFTLGNLFGRQVSHSLNLATMARLLAPHKSTLRTLSIGYLEIGGLDGFDLTGFTSLEDLTLSAWTTGATVGHEEKLLAPRLRKFTWNFPVEEARGYGPLHEFKAPQREWLRRLAGAAVRENLPLRLIYVDFYGVDVCGWADNLPEVYPWDYIDSVADEFRDAGIGVEYPPPILTKEAFYRRRTGGDGSPDTG